MAVQSLATRSSGAGGPWPLTGGTAGGSDGRPSLEVAALEDLPGGAPPAVVGHRSNPGSSPPGLEMVEGAKVEAPPTSLKDKLEVHSGLSREMEEGPGQEWRDVIGGWSGQRDPAPPTTMAGATSRPAPDPPVTLTTGSSDSLRGGEGVSESRLHGDGDVTEPRGTSDPGQPVTREEDRGNSKMATGSTPTPSHVTVPPNPTFSSETPPSVDPPTPSAVSDTPLSSRPITAQQPAAGPGLTAVPPPKAPGEDRPLSIPENSSQSPAPGRFPVSDWSKFS